MKTRGFTLAELLVVIVITGIIAAMSIVFFRPAVDAYFDAGRRAALTDAADTALRRIGRDVRAAVPNSIRTPAPQCFELVPTSAGGRYRMAPDTANAAVGCPQSLASSTCSAALDVANSASDTFDVLSPLANLPLTNLPTPGDWVVIGNQNTNDVYAGNDRAAIVAAITNPNASFGQYRIQVSNPSFPGSYTGGRFVIVPDNSGKPTVFYVCAGAAGTNAQGDGTMTLYRQTGPFSAAYPTACPAAGGDVLATNVKSCAFVYNPGLGGPQGFVEMQIELAAGNETISLSSGIHLDNVP